MAGNVRASRKKEEKEEVETPLERSYRYKTSSQLSATRQASELHVLRLPARSERYAKKEEEEGSLP